MRKVQTPSDAASMERYLRDISKATIFCVCVSVNRFGEHLLGNRFGEHLLGNPSRRACYLADRVIV